MITVGLIIQGGIVIRVDIVIGVLMLICFCSLFAGIFYLKNRSRLAERMESITRKRLSEKRDVLKELSSVVIKAAHRAGLDVDLASFDRKLFLAGRPFSLSAEEFAGAWIILIAAAVVSGFVLALTGALQPLFVVFLIGLAVFLPHLIVDSGAESGRDRLGSEVIDLILRLELGTSAGLGATRVLEWASEGNSMLAVLLKTLTKEVQMGRMTHVVFSRLADDYGIQEAREVAVALKQAEVQGVEIGPTLNDLSRDLRDSRERDADIQVVKMKPGIEGILTAAMMVAAIALMVGPLAAENLKVLDHMMGSGF